MTDDTPTTEEVKSAALSYSAIMSEADWDSWLAAHDAEVRAGAVAEEPQWEYSWAGTYDEGDDWVMDDAFDTRGAAVAYVTRPIGRWVNTDNGTLVRRRKAGPWVPVDEDGADQ